MRLRAGRTPADREAVLKPQMGLYAVHEGAPVLILECFTWRGNANGATHTIDKRSLRTCAAAELVSVGLNFHFLPFRETISTDPPLLGPSAAVPYSHVELLFGGGEDAPDVSGATEADPHPTNFREGCG